MNIITKLLSLFRVRKTDPVPEPQPLVEKTELVEIKSNTMPSIQEIQIKLAGFGKGTFDGIMGPGTAAQIKKFETDFMKVTPTGLLSDNLVKAINKFAEQFPLDFNQLKCPCGTCSGFGQGLYKNKYIDGKPKLEMYYMYEYPGIHKAILWAARAAFFYNPEFKFLFTAGYRCSVNNVQKNRTSTNHCGKAVDFDTLGVKGDEDKARCNKIRDIIVKTSGAQIGWATTNTKSLEPEDIAPTWVHYDVRTYDQKYLDDKFFCKTLEQLNGNV